MFETPVLFIVFNRPETTQKVFNQIRKIKPSFLFIAADGPRRDKVGEDQLCGEVKKIIVSNIDWECNVKTLFRKQNLGCGKAVSQAITWFFENVEEGIILEDDCLPDLTFFLFCQVMLDRYRNYSEIMHVGGNNFQFGIRRGTGDYYFSFLGHVWGWATWRRAWKKYSFNLSNEVPITDKAYNRALNKNKAFINYYKNIYSKMAAQQIDTWDYQWTFTIIRNYGLAICPNVNLIKNIGFGEDATHTLQEPTWIDQNESERLTSFNEPAGIFINYEADAVVMRKIFGVIETPKKIVIRRAIYSVFRKASCWFFRNNYKNYLLKK